MSEEDSSVAREPTVAGEKRVREEDQELDGEENKNAKPVENVTDAKMPSDTDESKPEDVADELPNEVNGAAPAPAPKDAKPRHAAPSAGPARPPLSAAQSSREELRSKCCVRFGVFSHRHIDTEAAFWNEIIAIKMRGEVETIEVEPFNPPRDSQPLLNESQTHLPRGMSLHPDNLLDNNGVAQRRDSEFRWARIYFNSAEAADIAVVRLNTPLRSSTFSVHVTQRLPIPRPTADSYKCDPPDTIVVGTQDDYVAFSTNEVYHSRGSIDFMQAKRNGRLIRRLVCKQFDPTAGKACPYGQACTFIHPKPEAMMKLIRTTTWRVPIKHSNVKKMEDMKISSYEYMRRRDTLILHNTHHSEKDIEYMFSNCDGFTEFRVFASNTGTESLPRHALIRFRDHNSALMALISTRGYGDLSLGFYGVMEDCRRLITEQEREEGRDREIGDRHPIESGPPADYHNFAQPHGRHLGRGRGRGPLPDSMGFRGRYGGGYAVPLPRRGNMYLAQPPFRQGDYEDGLIRPSTNDAPGKGYRQPEPRVESASAEGGDRKQMKEESGTENSDRRNATGRRRVPFPPLPEGWGHSISRNSGLYYFYKQGSKSTCWKHPTTGLKYSVED